MLPVVVMQHGGVTFLLMYTVMLLILGGPLLLLEVSLGQDVRMVKRVAVPMGPPRPLNIV